jgi:hypothetical protein
MKQRILSILTLVGLLTAPAAFAQRTTQPWYFASDYNAWSIQSQSANTYLFSPQGLCTASASGGQFFPFATNAPVLISDATPANSEVVTPSTATNTGSQCGFTASPANQHFSFQVKSGTAGLQEALNALAISAKTTTYPALILLDRSWYNGASSIPGTTATAIIGAAKSNAHAIVEDITTAAPTYYVWSGTALTSGTWINTPPTAAAGAAAGTAPTVGTTTGTALAPNLALTTGTATTTGTLFTLTYATSSQFLYAPTCTVVSSGANSFTAFTVATTYPSSTHALITVTATSAPAVSTAYKFSVNCY